MSDTRDDIDPEAIPTLTKIVVPGHVKQLSLDGVAEPEDAGDAAEAEASTDDDAARIETPPAEETSGTPVDEGLPDGETDAITLDDELARLTEELTGGGSPPENVTASAPDESGIEALVDEVLRRHTASLREELIGLVRRELARRSSSTD